MTINQRDHVVGLLDHEEWNLQITEDNMSALKPGTHCVIVAGCPENIGLIVEVVRHLGRCEAREDAYLVETLSGRNLNQLWQGEKLIRGYSSSCITDRHKLRPLVDPKDECDSKNEKVPVTVEDRRKVIV